MDQSEGFSGFPEGQPQTTPIPSLFFSELLTRIDHLGELKLTLYALWVLSKKEPKHKYLRRGEVRRDDLFMRSLRTRGMTPDEVLDDAFERTTARGSLIKATLEFREGAEEFYFLNSPQGRANIQGIQEGNWQPSGDPEYPVELRTERPNSYVLYEQNIGPLTPMIADHLREAETRYPTHWIEEAIGIAVDNNVRKWRYIDAILEDWQLKGKDDRETRGDTERARRRYLQGRFAEFID
jgi:DnaD/phage-associated family protein